MGTNGAVEGTGDLSVSFFQTKKALSCHLVIKHTSYKTSRQRTNPVTSDTTANCCRLALLGGTHTRIITIRWNTGHKLCPLSCGHWAVAQQLAGPRPGYHFCSSVLFQSGGAPSSLHLSACFPPTLTASPALDHEEPRIENKQLSSTTVALIRSPGDVGASKAQGQEQVGPSGVTTCISAWPCHCKGLALGNPFPS